MRVDLCNRARATQALLTKRGPELAVADAPCIGIKLNAAGALREAAIRKKQHLIETGEAATFYMTIPLQSPSLEWKSPS